MTEKRTPLKRAMGLGSSKEGVHHWLSQRASGVALAFLGLWVLLSLSQLPKNYDAFALWLQNPGVTFFLSLSLVVGFYHGYLGLQVIIEDYVRRTFTRVTLLLALKFFFGILITGSLVALIRLNGS